MDKVKVVVQQDGSIFIPDNLRKQFGTYVALHIKCGNVVIRIPVADDRWNESQL